MDRKIETELLLTFKELFSKQHLRKNIYLFQNLAPDMTLPLRVLLHERRVASISKDPQPILAALAQCPEVEILGQDTVRLLVAGDKLVVQLSSAGDKKMGSNEIKKIVGPLIKDIRHEFREQRGKLEVQFATETAVLQFLERAKSKNANIHLQAKSKDPYECIKESIRLLRKERKAQLKEAELQKNMHMGMQIPMQQYYHSYPSAYMGQYQPFIRKSVPSDDEEPVQVQKVVQSKEDVKNEEVRRRLDLADFPQLQ